MQNFAKLDGSVFRHVHEDMEVSADGLLNKRFLCVLFSAKHRTLAFCKEVMASQQFF
jgi:hypothetical protein